MDRKEIERILHEYIKNNLKVVTKCSDGYLETKIYLGRELITEDDAYVG